MAGDLGARRALRNVSITLVLALSAWFSATAVIPQLRTEWSLSSGVASLLTIAVQIGFVLGAIASSFVNLSDILPPARVIAMSSFGVALANGALYLVDSSTPAITLRILTGFFYAGVYPPAFKLMSTWFRAGRGLALGILVGALTLGSAAPHLVNGAGGLHWRTVVLISSGLALVGAAVAAFAVEEGPYPFPRAVFDPRQVGRTMANRGVRLASLGYFGHMWELYAMWAWFHVFFAEAVGGTTEEAQRAGALGAFVAIGIGAVGCYLGGVLGDRWGRTKTTATSLALSGSCAAVIGFLVDAPPWLVLLIGAFWGAVVIADSAQFSTMVTELADQSYVGTAVTLQLAFGFTLTVVTIRLIPFLQGRAGWGWAFATLALGPALGILAMARLHSLPEGRVLAARAEVKAGSSP